MNDTNAIGWKHPLGIRSEESYQKEISALLAERDAALKEAEKCEDAYERAASILADVRAERDRLREVLRNLIEQTRDDACRPEHINFNFQMRQAWDAARAALAGEGGTR